MANFTIFPENNFEFATGSGTHEYNMCVCLLTEAHVTQELGQTLHRFGRKKNIQTDLG